MNASKGKGEEGRWPQNHGSHSDKNTSSCSPSPSCHSWLHSTLPSWYPFLRSANEPRESKPGFEDQCQVIDGLDCYSSFICLQIDCQYATRHSREMRKHMPLVHQIKAAAHKKSALWKECKLQTYFTAKGLISVYPGLQLLSLLLECGNIRIGRERG